MLPCPPGQAEPARQREVSKCESNDIESDVDSQGNQRFEMDQAGP